jgi:hypothetical protein
VSAVDFNPLSTNQPSRIKTKNLSRVEKKMDYNPNGFAKQVFQPG